MSEQLSRLGAQASKGGQEIFHLIAIITSAVWGTTFISSKVLLEYGLSPAEIMLLRFLLAYILILPFAFRGRGKLFANTIKDELELVALGVSGGSIYFLLENTALVYTQASNVAIIIASTPLLTTLTVHLISRQESADKRLYYYSLLSLLGVAMVVFNGEFILKLNPLGDILTLGAAVSWVIYSIIVLRVQEKYDSLMITRKVFFYGVVTLLPYFYFYPLELSWSTLLKPVVAGNLLYLGLLASLICYWTWNLCIEKLGAIRSTNYLYINPIVAMVTAYFVLDERITPLAIIGTLLIIAGVYMAQRKKKRITKS